MKASDKKICLWGFWKMGALMVEFIEEQCDIDGNKIINEIGTRGNIVINHGTKLSNPGGIIIGGNEFY